MQRRKRSKTIEKRTPPRRAGQRDGADATRHGRTAAGERRGEETNGEQLPETLNALQKWLERAPGERRQRPWSCK